MTHPSGLIMIDDRVLVEIPEVDEKTAGGIILPDAVKDRNQDSVMTGICASVGPMAWWDILQVDAETRIPQPGDTIRISKYAGVMTEGLDGKSYRVVNAGDVWAIEKGTDNE